MYKDSGVSWEGFLGIYGQISRNSGVSWLHSDFMVVLRILDQVKAN